MSPALAIKLGENRLRWITDEEDGFVELVPDVAAPLVGLHKQHGRVCDAFGWKAALKQPVILVNGAGEDAGGLLEQIAQPGVAAARKARQGGIGSARLALLFVIKFEIITFR